MYKLTDFQIMCYDKFSDLIFTMFTYVPETPNEAYQFSTQEKIRAFNNSCLYLYDFYVFINENFSIINKQSWNSIDNRKMRQLFGMLYKELFSYQEKIVKFVADLLHIQDEKLISTEKSLQKINKYSINFDFIRDFVKQCKKISKDTEYIKFRQIRADEVHNINQWDIVNYNFVNADNGFNIVPTSYKIDSSIFYNNLMYVVDIFIKLKKFVESFTTVKNILRINEICKIYKKDQT